VHDIRYFNNVVYHNTDIQGSGWKGRAMSFFSSEGAHPVHDIHVFNNTFVGNQRLGIHVDNPDIKNLFIRNNIIVSNGGADIEVSQASSVTVEDNLLSVAVSNAIGGALTARNNIIADPRFVNAAGNDYHLQSISPAVDRAVGSDVATLDYDGSTRPAGAAADLGAYEFGAAPGAGTGGRSGSGGGGTAAPGYGTGGAAGAATGDGTGGAVAPATGGVAGGTGEAGKTGTSGCECNTGADASASPFVLVLFAALLGRRKARSHRRAIG
jgi:hypothetical protein